MIARAAKRFGMGLVVILLCGALSPAQEPPKFVFRATHYEVNASLDPPGQSLAARVRVDFEARVVSRIVEVELHPNLRVRSVTDAAGNALEFEQDAEKPLVLRATLPQTVAEGARVTLHYEYEGRLSGDENSPVKGVQLARIGAQETYLLQPARWFPLTDFPGNRYTATFNLEVPEGLDVVGTGKASPPQPVTPRPPALPAKRPGKVPTPAPATAPAPATPAGPRTLYVFQVERPEAAGTFVIGKIQVTPTRTEGIEVPVYSLGPAPAAAAAHGESAARIVTFFSSEFGGLPRPNLALMQIPDGTVQGYSAPGLLLVSQRQWDPRVNYRLLARLAAQQWFGLEVTPASSADVWLSDGLARYAEALYVNQLAGTQGFNSALEDFAIGALMYEDAAPVSQAQRLEPFTSEYRSVVINKGALVFHMLRSQVGDETFRDLLRNFFSSFAGKSARLEDFQKLAQEKSRQAAAARSQTAPNLNSFFAQWLSSTGVPEFKLEYVVYRTQKGFRIVGKVKQDLDTFRLPVDVKIETEGNPEFKTIDVIGSNSDFMVETFGRPKPNGLTLDPNNNLLKSSRRLRLRSAIARGEELAEAGDFYEAIQQYQRALEVDKNNSLAHFRMGEAMFFQKNLQAAANAFRDAQVGDADVGYKWVVVWSHIYLGKIFDLTGQRERAVNEYQKAVETNDDTGGAQAEAQRWLQQPYSEEAARKSS